ncbi:MAG: 4Fe-4S dicluster domain-containing protein [Deltaproteobacteria bacterium]|nr:4Fe-4S dicluster domain-containing protein [Deltaproteobacteria bacterium]
MKEPKKSTVPLWIAVRRIYQVFFLGLFALLLLLASNAYLEHHRHAVGLFLEADPLIALGAALGGKVVFGGTILALVVVLLTLVFGRVFCSFICPLGILNHAVSALPSVFKRSERQKANEWRPLYQLKYYVLLALLVGAALGVLQVGLLDPIALTVRTAAVTLLPGLQLAGVPLYAEQPSYLHGWIVGGLFVLLLFSNRLIMRFWCRALCPLGGLLGLVARFSLFRVWRDPKVCLDCHKCNEACHGACDPHGKLRFADCVMCLNCFSACPQSGGMRYGLLPPTPTEVASPDLGRRQTAAALASGVALLPVLRTSNGVLRGAAHDVIRPPGSLSEEDFAAKCVKCGLCMRACPTSVLQPAGLQAGLEGLWSPILRYDQGFCSHECTLCSQVCPTGAIRPVTAAERSGEPPYSEPLKLGTAFYDRGRCLPWSMATPCIVCEEVCPTSPKAIWLEDAEVKRRDGSTVKVQLPHLDPERCIGCGTCQYRCPVGTEAAIRVSSVGESRSLDNRMLIRSY